MVSLMGRRQVERERGGREGERERERERGRERGGRAGERDRERETERERERAGGPRGDHSSGHMELLTGYHAMFCFGFQSFLPPFSSPTILTPPSLLQQKTRVFWHKYLQTERSRRSPEREKPTGAAQHSRCMKRGNIRVIRQ